MTCLRFFLVLQRHLRRRSYVEIDRDESQVLFSSWMEYFRFYYRGFIFSGILPGRCSRSFSFTIVQIGRYFFEAELKNK